MPTVLGSLVSFQSNGGSVLPSMQRTFLAVPIFSFLVRPVSTVDSCCAWIALLWFPMEKGMKSSVGNRIFFCTPESSTSSQESRISNRMSYIVLSGRW
jgi:hypothetical protein